MDNPNYSTEHRKGQHLLAEERHEIEVRLKDGWSTYRIAKHLGRPYNTIKLVGDTAGKAFAVIVDEAHSSQTGQSTMKLSFYAFTATPKDKTLEIFGDEWPDGTFHPFHVYSMRQAIEEGFIMASHLMR